MSKEPILDKDTYRTPFEVFYYVEHEFGQIAYDTACTKANALAKPVWELSGFKRGDALSFIWPDKTGLLLWCNPPYSKGNIEAFVGMASQLRHSSVVFLIPPSNGEVRYQYLQDQCFEINIIGRLPFRHPTKNQSVNGNRGGSSLFVTNPQNLACGIKKGQRWTVPRSEIYRIGKKEMGL